MKSSKPWQTPCARSADLLDGHRAGLCLGRPWVGVTGVAGRRTDATQTPRPPRCLTPVAARSGPRRTLHSCPTEGQDHGG